MRFGEKYADELDKSRNIAVVLNSYATELAGDGKRVTGAKLWSNGRDAGTFAADYFVTCTGPEAALRGPAYVAWEQAPLASNQIGLSKADVDYAGVPRIELHWKKSPLERRTLLEGLRLFGTTLAQKNLGRVRIDDWISAIRPRPSTRLPAGWAITSAR